MPDLSPLERALLEKQIVAARAKMQQEMPDVASKVSVTPAGWMDRMREDVRHNLIGSSGAAMADTSPLTGNITYYPESLKGLEQTMIDNLLAHELTHSRQALSKPWHRRVIDIFKNSPYERYGAIPEELEAFQTEADRSQPRSTNLPSFGEQGYRYRGDIRLPKGKP